MICAPTQSLGPLFRRGAQCAPTVRELPRRRRSRIDTPPHPSSGFRETPDATFSSRRRLGGGGKQNAFPSRESSFRKIGRKSQKAGRCEKIFMHFHQTVFSFSSNRIFLKTNRRKRAIIEAQTRILREDVRSSSAALYGSGCFVPKTGIWKGFCLWIFFM